MLRSSLEIMVQPQVGEAGGLTSSFAGMIGYEHRTMTPSLLRKSFFFWRSKPNADDSSTRAAEISCCWQTSTDELQSCSSDYGISELCARLRQYLKGRAISSRSPRGGPTAGLS